MQAGWTEHPVATLIGDVVRSRTSENRASLQLALNLALQHANDHTAPLQPLAPTIGDEFQGVYRTIGEAIKARVLVQHEFRWPHGVTFGIGWGPILVHDTSALPLQQDGPGWWSARDALDDVSRQRRRRSARPHISTQVRAESDPHGFVATINALLAVVDHHLGVVVDERGEDDRVFHMLRIGETVEQIAKERGVTHQAVSARARRNGLYALTDLLAALDDTKGNGPG